MAAQDRRRDLGRQVASVEMRLKELHSEMQNTMKGDDKYLHLCTEEHKVGFCLYLSIYIHIN